MLAPCKLRRNIADMHLQARRAIVKKILEQLTVPVEIDVFEESQDLLALLRQWESGTIQGIPVVIPPLDPSRSSESVPNNEAT